MGTRNLTCVFADGAYKVAQYCQWDGYPSGQGMTVLKFLSTPGNITKLKANLPKLSFATEAQIKKAWVAAGADPKAEWVNTDVSDRFNKINPQLSRDTGADVLGMIANLGPKDTLLLKNDIAFAGNGLFCEWCYVIDFDLGVLQVYEGFKKMSVGRFAKFERQNEDYAPVSLRRFWLLNKLPTKKSFLAALEPEDESVSV